MSVAVMGCVPLQGFDEYMNLVLDDAEEVDVKKRTRKGLGTLLQVNRLPLC